MTIEHRLTKEIICPYCGKEYQDSWEFEDDEGVETCINCEKDFSYSREVWITYSTEIL